MLLHLLYPATLLYIALFLQVSFWNLETKLPAAVEFPTSQPEQQQGWGGGKKYPTRQFLWIINSLVNILSLDSLKSADLVGICLNCCGGLILPGHQVLTKATLSLPSSAGQGRENRRKNLWVEISTGRDHSPITVMGKPDSTWGKLIYYQSKSA